MNRESRGWTGQPNLGKNWSLTKQKWRKGETRPKNFIIVDLLEQEWKMAAIA